MGESFIFVCQQCTLVAEAANCRAEHCRGAASKAKQVIVPSAHPLWGHSWSSVCPLGLSRIRKAGMQWQEPSRDGLSWSSLSKRSWDEICAVFGYFIKGCRADGANSSFGHTVKRQKAMWTNSNMKKCQLETKKRKICAGLHRDFVENILRDTQKWIAQGPKLPGLFWPAWSKS